MSMSDDKSIETMFRRMFLIRRFEERLIDLHGDGHVAGIYHLYISQEATGVGVTANMGGDDILYSTHRNHGHLLARGAEPGPIYAELLGRSGGCCGGYAGSMHLAAPELGIPATSAMVGGGVPQAVGAALSRSRLHPGSLAVSFFGDGTCEEGAIYEAFNIASIWKLPVLFVCENNSSPETAHIPGALPSIVSEASRLTDMPTAFGIPSVQLDGRDVIGFSEACGQLMQEIREGGGPRFIEARTTRWPGSHMVWPSKPWGLTKTEWLTGEQTPPDEIASWIEFSDPLRIAAVRGELSGERVHAIEAEVAQEIEEAIEWALASPVPTSLAFDTETL